MENQASYSAQDATSYNQDSTSAQSGQNQNSNKSGMLSNIQIPDAVKNMQLPQSVKDLGTTVSRSYNGMSTTQKVLGGAALLGASYWVASNQGWIGKAKLGKIGKKSKGSKNQYSGGSDYSTNQYGDSQNS
ncbi:hypothetical protein [Rufibacter tibetensis]|uniref:Uncharacterized protein n=1 Tax=Rufibacter tibetensis TaxID=512763 RepID=A0A0P0CNR5_9BACT|nr:hypothetical protein [Rufibacter tibetensis]ALI98827.1 hypothetical protein DC20_07370 [Rufibacter tibetensis]